MEEHAVHIIDWPKDQAAKLEHHFPKPVDLNMFNNSERPLHLNMNLGKEQVLPVCIKLCEPICAESSYRIGINLMGQSFADITIKGITRLFNCREQKENKPIE